MLIAILGIDQTAICVKLLFRWGATWSSFGKLFEGFTNAWVKDSPTGEWEARELVPICPQIFFGSLWTSNSSYRDSASEPDLQKIIVFPSHY